MSDRQKVSKNTKQKANTSKNNLQINDKQGKNKLDGLPIVEKLVVAAGSILMEVPDIKEHPVTDLVRRIIGD